MLCNSALKIICCWSIRYVCWYQDWYEQDPTDETDVEFQIWTELKNAQSIIFDVWISNVKKKTTLIQIEIYQSKDLQMQLSALS